MADSTVHALFEAQAARTPAAVAADAGNARLTYHQLNRHANQLAHYLRHHDVGPDTPVGICIAPSPALAVALLGVLKAGAAFVPIDPLLLQEQAALAATAADLVILLTQARLVSVLPATDATVVRIDADWAIVADEPATNPEPVARPDDLACLFAPLHRSTHSGPLAIRHRELIQRVGGAAPSAEPPPPAPLAPPPTAGLSTVVEEILGALVRGSTATLRGRLAP